MKPPFFLFRRGSVIGVLVLLTLGGWLGVFALQAQTSVWTGAVSNSWGSPGNWTNSPAFDGTDRLLLSTLQQPSQVLGAIRSIHSLTISQGDFTVAGNSLYFYNDGAGIFSTGNNTINSNILPLVATSIRSNSGTLTLGGVVSTTNGAAPAKAPVFEGAGNITVSGSIQGGGGLTMNGTGTLLLSGTNFFNGAMFINSGTLKFAATASNTANGPLVLSSGTLDLNGLDTTVPSLSGAGAILLGGNTLTITGGGSLSYPLNFTGPVSGTGGVVLQLTAGNAQSLGGANTYTGGTTVKSGFLSYNVDSNLGAPAGKLTLDGGGIKFFKDGTITRPVVVGGGGATFSTDPRTTSSLPSSISGTGPVNYGYNTGGEGTWIAAGNYTYTGKTTIGTGNLAITNNAQLGAADNAVAASGGTLLLRGGVTVAGRTITLSGYGNSTNESLGTLVSDSGANAWTGPVVINYVGRIGVAAGSTLTLSGSISGNAECSLNSIGDTLITGTASTSIGKGGAGTLTLSGNNAAYGLSVAGGTAFLAGANAVTGPNGVTLDRGGTLRLGTNQTLTRLADYGSPGGTVDLGSYDLTLTNGGSFAGTIGGAGRLFMQGKGTLSLTGNNTFTGGLYIDGGTLVVGSDASLGAASNPVVFRGGTLQVYGSTYPSTNHPLTFATPDVSLNVYNGTFTLAQTLENTGSLKKLGAGTLVLTGTNTYAGGTILSEGAVSVASDASLGASGGGLSLQGGTLQVTGNSFHSTTRPLTSGTGYTGFDIADPANTFTLGSITGGAGGINKLGAGTLVLAGQTTLNTLYALEGVLRLGASNAVTANSMLGVSSGATFDMAGFSQTADRLSVGGTFDIGTGVLSVTSGITGYGSGSLSGGQLVLAGSSVTLFSNGNGTQPGKLVITAPISGSGTMNLQGIGNVVLAGDNPFTGTTVVTSGKHTLTGSLLQTVGMSIARGALFEVAGGGRLGVNGNLTNNGFLRLTGSGTLAVGGVITNNGVLDISQWGGTLPGNIINNQGGVVLDAKGLQIVGFTRTASSVQITVNGQVGLSYQLQNTANLSSGSWQNAGTSSVPTAATVNGPFTLTDNYPLTTPQGFYRVVVSQSTGSSGH